MFATRITRSASTRDDALERAFAARDEWAYEEAYRRFGARMYATAMRLLRDTESASDCVHDVLLHLWKRADAYRADRGSLEAFLATCVRNDALARLRDEGRHERRLRALPREEPVEELDVDPVERERVAAAVASLDEVQRDAIERAYYRGMTQSEIARETNAPLGTVKTRIAAALRNLRRMLNEEPSRD